MHMIDYLKVCPTRVKLELADHIVIDSELEWDLEIILSHTLRLLGDFPSFPNAKLWLKSRSSDSHCGVYPFLLYFTLPLRIKAKSTCQLEITRESYKFCMPFSGEEPVLRSSPHTSQ